MQESDLMHKTGMPGKIGMSSLTQYHNRSYPARNHEKSYFHVLHPEAFRLFYYMNASLHDTVKRELAVLFLGTAITHNDMLATGPMIASASTP